MSAFICEFCRKQLDIDGVSDDQAHFFKIKEINFLFSLCNYHHLKHTHVGIYEISSNEYMIIKMMES